MKLFQRLLTDAPLISDGAVSALLAQHQNFDLSMLVDPKAAESPFAKRLREYLKPQMTVTEDGIAVVPVEGILARKPDAFELFFGVEDSLNVLEMFESARQNPLVKGVLADFDSPGGFMTGGPEIGDAIKETAKTKPVVAWTGGTMGSLAYWLGSQASSIVASRSAQVGSIGIFTTHIDASERLKALGLKVEVIKNKEADYKAAGIFNTSLTDAQREHIQGMIQASFREFQRTVKAARPNIEDDSMRGQTFFGVEAKKAGLVDRVGDRSFALSVLRKSIRAQR